MEDTAFALAAKQGNLSAFVVLRAGCSPTISQTWNLYLHKYYGDALAQAGNSVTHYVGRLNKVHVERLQDVTKFL